MRSLIVSDLDLIVAGALRQRNLMVMRILQQRLAIHHGHARAGFAEVRRGRIETLAGTGIGFAGGVAILEDGIGGEVPIGGRSGTKRSRSVAQKLNVLRLTAKLKVEKLAEREAIGIGHRDRFQSSATRDGIGRGEAPHDQGNGRSPTSVAGPPVRCANHAVGHAGRVSEVPFEANGGGMK